MFERLRKLFNKKTEEPVENQKKNKGGGRWKTDKYSLTSDKGDRRRFNYRFDEKLEFVCKCNKNEGAEVAGYIEDLLNRGFDKEQVKAKAKDKFNLKHRSKAKKRKRRRKKV